MHFLRFNGLQFLEELLVRLFHLALFGGLELLLLCEFSLSSLFCLGDLLLVVALKLGFFPLELYLRFLLVESLRKGEFLFFGGEALLKLLLEGLLGYLGGGS